MEIIGILMQIDRLVATYRSPTYVANPNDVTFNDSATKLFDKFSTIRFTIFGSSKFFHSFFLIFLIF